MTDVCPHCKREFHYPRYVQGQYEQPMPAFLGNPNSTMITFSHEYFPACPHCGKDLNREAKA